MKTVLYSMLAMPVVCLVAQAENGVETRDEQMCTPLMQAVASYPSVSLEKIREMIAAGADVNALTIAGHTPLDVALEQKGDEEKPIDEKNGTLPLQQEVIALLQERGRGYGWIEFRD